MDLDAYSRSPEPTFFAPTFFVLNSGLAAVLGLMMTISLPAVGHAQTPDDEPSAEESDDEISSATLQQAEEHFKRGVELYEDRDFDRALFEFRLAYETAPHFRVLYNIGVCYLELHDYAGAIRTLERFLGEGGAEIDPTQQREVRSDIEKVQGRVGHLRVKTNVPAADVTVDDESVGQSPVEEALLVNIGTHVVRASRQGYVATRRVVEVIGGQERTVYLELTPQGVSTSKATQPSSEELAARNARRAKRRKRGIIAGSVTAALAAGAVAAGVLAWIANEDLKDERAARPGDADQIDDARDRTFRRSVAFDALAIGAVVMTGVTLTLRYAGARKDRDKDAATRQTPSLAVDVGPAGASLRGRF